MREDDMLRRGIGMTSQRTRERLIQRLCEEGVSNTKVLDVIRRTPRHLFVDEALAHRFIAGGDVLAVPSRFEPCGLTQLYALRYGTLPLVRRVGGLADTVVDASVDHLAADRATGFAFAEASGEAVGRRIREACALYRQPAAWRKVQRRAMAQNFSWDDSAAHYAALYRSL